MERITHFLTWPQFTSFRLFRSKKGIFIITHQIKWALSVKFYFKQSLKNRQNECLKTTGSLMQVKSIAKWSMRATCIKRLPTLKTNLSSFEWLLKTGLTVIFICNWCCFLRTILQRGVYICLSNKFLIAKAVLWAAFKIQKYNKCIVSEQKWVSC